MCTATARRHVENALRARLGIRTADAREIVTSWENGNTVFRIKRDMRGCVAVATEGCTWVEIHAPGGNGVHDLVLSVNVRDSLFARWRAMPLEQAYGMPEGVVLRADLDHATVEESEAAITPHFGPAPDPRDHVWVDGTVTDVRILDERTLVVDAVVDGVAGRYVKFPVLGTVEQVAAYVRGKIDVPARLCLEDQRFDPVPGFEDCRVVEMIVPDHDRHRLRMAA